MRRLYLFRHAKTERAAADGGDHARALTARGCDDAEAMARELVEQFPPPVLILCSTATRTRQTLARTLPRCRSPEVVFDDRLYLASAGVLLSIINAAPADAEPLMVIGHNDGLGELARLLAGSGETRDLLALGIKFPTAALAVIAFDVETWAGIVPRAGRLERLLIP